MVLYMVLDPDPIGHGTVSKPTRITQRPLPHLIPSMHQFLPLLSLSPLSTNHFNLPVAIHTISHHCFLTLCFPFTILSLTTMHIPTNTLMLHTQPPLLSWMHPSTPHMPPTWTMHMHRVFGPTLQAFHVTLLLDLPPHHLSKSSCHTWSLWRNSAFSMQSMMRIGLGW